MCRARTRCTNLEDAPVHLNIEGKDVAAQISANSRVNESLPKCRRNFGRQLPLIWTREAVDGERRVVPDNERVLCVGWVFRTSRNQVVST
jgi:hypothetical protein